MAPVELIVAAAPESVFDIGDRLTGSLKQAKQEAIDGGIPGNVLARLADTVEALRSRVVHKVERDPRSLFDLDERLIELLECADEAAQDGEVPQELLQRLTIIWKRSKQKWIELPVIGAGRSRLSGSAEKERTGYRRGSERPSGE